MFESLEKGRELDTVRSPSELIRTLNQINKSGRFSTIPGITVGLEVAQETIKHGENTIYSAGWTTQDPQQSPTALEVVGAGWGRVDWGAVLDAIMKVANADAKRALAGGTAAAVTGAGVAVGAATGAVAESALEVLDSLP